VSRIRQILTVEVRRADPRIKRTTIHQAVKISSQVPKKTRRSSVLRILLTKDALANRVIQRTAIDRDRTTDRQVTLELKMSRRANRILPQLHRQVIQRPNHQENKRSHSTLNGRRTRLAGSSPDATSRPRSGHRPAPAFLLMRCRLV